MAKIIGKTEFIFIQFQKLYVVDFQIFTYLSIKELRFCVRKKMLQFCFIFTIRQAVKILVADISKIISFNSVVLPEKIWRDVFSRIYFDISPGDRRQASSEKHNSGWKINPE